MFRLGRIETIAGSLLGIVATIALLTFPIVQYCFVEVTDAGNSEASVRCEYTDLIRSQGGHLEAVTWAFLLGMTTLSAAAGIVAFGFKRPNLVLAVVLLLLGTLLGVGMFIAGFSIGLFYAPAAFVIELGAITLLFASK